MAKPKTLSTEPKYSQHSVRLPDQLFADVQHALIKADGRSYGFGALVEHLLDTWIRSGAKLPKD